MTKDPSQGFQGRFVIRVKVVAGLGNVLLPKQIHRHGQSRYDDQTDERTFSHRLIFRANLTWSNARADD